MYLSFNSFDNHNSKLSEDKDAIMRNPLVSPVYGDFKIINEENEPIEVFITSGTRDLFLSNCVRLYQQMKRGGISVELDIKEGMWHVYQIYGIPEGDESAREIGEFLKNI